MQALSRGGSCSFLRATAHSRSCVHASSSGPTSPKRVPCTPQAERAALRASASSSSPTTTDGAALSAPELVESIRKKARLSAALRSACAGERSLSSAPPHLRPSTYTYVRTYVRTYYVRTFAPFPTGASFTPFFSLQLVVGLGGEVTVTDLRGDGRHLNVSVVSKSFEGKNSVQRQREVRFFFVRNVGVFRH